MNWVVAGTDDDARAFLGPLATEFLTFADPERTYVKALGLERLPAFVFLRVDGQVVASAEGWNAARVASRWPRPSPRRRPGRAAVIPAPGDPQAYAGTLALA